MTCARSWPRVTARARAAAGTTRSSWLMTQARAARRGSRPAACWPMRPGASGELRIAGKGGRTDILPPPADVGEAMPGTDLLYARWPRSADGPGPTRGAVRPRWRRPRSRAGQGGGCQRAGRPPRAASHPVNCGGVRSAAGAPMEEMSGRRATPSSDDMADWTPRLRSRPGWLAWPCPARREPRHEPMRIGERRSWPRAVRLVYEPARRCPECCPGLGHAGKPKARRLPTPSAAALGLGDCLTLTPDPQLPLSPPSVLPLFDPSTCPPGTPRARSCSGEPAGAPPHRLLLYTNSVQIGGADRRRWNHRRRPCQRRRCRVLRCRDCCDRAARGRGARPRR